MRLSVAYFKTCGDQANYHLIGKQLIKNNMRFIYYTLLILTLSSCNCQKQLAKIHYKCPELFTIDTIRQTTIIPEYKYDTLFYFPKGYQLQIPRLIPYSPLVIPVTGSRLTGNITIDTNSLKTNLIIPTDTIIVEIPVEKIMPCSRKHLPEDYKEKKRKTFSFGLVSGISILLILSIIIKRWKV